MSNPQPNYDAVEQGWFETFTGRKFYFNIGAQHNVYLPDIAHALAFTCRYNGHVRKHYSVAEHTALLAHYVFFNSSDRWPDRRERARNALTMLHHDDAEAYIGDMVRPLKQLFPKFREVEASIDRQIATEFGVEYPHPAWVKELDTRILQDERAQCLSASGNEWATDSLVPLGVTISFWPGAIAEQIFLRAHDTYAALAAGRSIPSTERGGPAAQAG